MAQLLVSKNFSALKPLFFPGEKGLEGFRFQTSRVIFLFLFVVLRSISTYLVSLGFILGI